MIAASLRALRPRVEVKSASPEALEEHLERFKPDLVICSGHDSMESGGRPAWVGLSMDPLQPSKIRVGRRHSEWTNPTLGVLLEVIDEVEQLL